jgi:TatA/E family protein of Tat protein translocase
MGLSLSHILIFLIIILILFRPRKVSELSKSIGQAYRNFKQSLNEIEIEARDIQDIAPKANKERDRKTT